MKVHDYLACKGNICASDPENELRNWWPGELVCTATPYTKWQRVQIRINKLLLKNKLKNLNSYYFLKDLLKIGRVTHATTGIPSERKFPAVGLKYTPVTNKMPYNVRGSEANILQNYMGTIPN